MAHIKPLPRGINAELEARFDHYEATRGFIPNSILTMQHRPAIASAFMELNRAVLYEGSVSVELKMLVSLMSSYAAGCRYCQSHMANLASIYDAPDEKIAALWNFDESDIFSEAERAALRLALNAGGVPNMAESSNFDELRKYFDDAEIVEIVAAISLFGYLNRWNDTMATQLEELPAKVAGRMIARVGWEAGKHG